MGGAGCKAVAARAHDANFVVSGMNGCFHDLLTSVPNHSILKDGRRIQQMDMVPSFSHPDGRGARLSIGGK
jgi:hypothetical protein